MLVSSTMDTQVRFPLPARLTLNTMVMTIQRVTIHFKDPEAWKAQEESVNK